MTKLCTVCLKSDILCAGCSRKLERGEITKIDMELERALFRLGIEVEFIKSFDEGNIYVMATKKQAGLLIGRAGRNAKRLGIMLGKGIRIIEATDDEKLLIERVLGFQVTGINKVYASGNEIHKIRMHRKYKERTANYSQVLAKMIGRPVSFVFE